MAYQYKTTQGLSVLAVFTGLTACTSLDPKPDFDRAREIASPRLNTDIDLESALSRNPNELPSSWDGTAPLDINTAVLIAFERDTMIRRAMEEIAIRRADLVQSELAPNPVVNFGVGIAVDGMSGAPAIVQVLQQLSWLWKRPHMIDATNAQRRRAILAAADRATILSTDVRTAHASTLEAQSRVELDKKYSDITSQTIDVVERIAEAGESSRIDIDRALLEHSEAYAALIASRSWLKQTKLAMLEAIGIPAFTTDWVVHGEFDLSTDVPSEEEIIQRARTVRLDVAMASEDIESALADSKLAGTRRIPEVAISLGWQQSFSLRRAVVPGGSVSLPIFDDGSPAIAAADSEVHIAILNLLQVRRNAVSEARTNLEIWRRSEQQASLYQKTVIRPALEAQQLSAQAYEEGEIDLTVLLLSQRKLIQAQRSLLQYQAAATTNLFALELSVGGSFELPVQPTEAITEDNAKETS